MILTPWKKRVAELRSQYDWLLFFSMPKLLRLYYLLQVEDPNLEAIVHEISFLCCNEQAALESMWKMVEVRGYKEDWPVWENKQYIKIDMGLCFNYLCSALQLVIIVLFGLF